MEIDLNTCMYSKYTGLLKELVQNMIYVRAIELTFNKIIYFTEMASVSVTLILNTFPFFNETLSLFQFFVVYFFLHMANQWKLCTNFHSLPQPGAAKYPNFIQSLAGYSNLVTVTCCFNAALPNSQSRMQVGLNS